MTSVVSRNTSQRELSKELPSRKRRHHSRESDSPVREKSLRDEDTRGQNGNTEEVEKKYVDIASLYGKTGGAYIPPARLKQMQAQITDKSSQAYQRIAWEALKKSIHGFINKVNVSNISNVVRQLLCENVVRGRGLLVRSLITAQTASPTFTHVFAALVAVINSKFPQVGELALKRLINEFRKAFRRNQKDRCLSTARFLAHLVNQKVVHELIILELLTLLLEQTTDDSVEVAVAVLKECGAMLTKLVPKGIHGIFEHLRRILNEGNCDKRICYMLEVMFQIRRDGWKDHPIVLPELDLIPEDDQITHTTSLLDQVDPEDKLNVFRFDPDYLESEEKYAKIRASFFDSDDEDSDAASDDEDDEDEEGEGNDVGGEAGQGAALVTATGGDSQGKQQQETIIDRTETNLLQLRRTIYLMLQSSVSADEGGHRILQLKIRPGEEYEVASMVLDCCAQTRSYETRYGRLAQRLCHVLIKGPPPPTNSGTVRQSTDLGPGSRYAKSDPLVNRNAKVDESAAAVEDTGPPRSYVGEFERIFGEQYAIIHRLETAKLRNVALFYAHLLYTDSISWGVLQCIRLNERDTTSSGRIFLKHLLLELCSFMGLAKLQARLKDETLQPFFAGLLPKDNPKDTRFAINFLTTIGLGAVTLDLRDHLESSREAALAKRQAEAEEAELTAFVESCTSSSSSSSSSESDEEEEDKERRKHRKRKTGKKEKKKGKDKEEKHNARSPRSASKKTGSDTKDSRRRNQVDTASKKSHDSRTKQPRPIDTPFFNDTPNSPARVLPATKVSSSAKRERPRNSLSPTSPLLRSTVVRVTQENQQFGDAVENRKSSLEDDLPDHDVHWQHSKSLSPPPRPAARAPSPKYKSSSGRDRSPHSGATDSQPSGPLRSEESQRGGDRQRSDAETGRSGRGRQRSPHSVSSRERRSRSRDRQHGRKSPPPAGRFR